MEQVVDKVFTDERVTLDGTLFINCTFRHTQLAVTGERDFGLQGCTFEDAAFSFEGPAGRIISLIRQMRTSGLDVVGT